MKLTKLLIPLLLLTACDENLPKDFQVEEVQKIKHIGCEINRGKENEYDVIFKGWYEPPVSSAIEPNYTHWYSRRNSVERAGKDCDAFIKYMDKIRNDKKTRTTTRND